MGKLSLSLPPVYDKLIKENDFIHVEWQTWLNQIYDAVDNHGFLPNDHLVLNPDFHWSRTVGNTPTIGNGEFVEKWNVNVGGMTSTVTPTFYTSTVNNAQTGSQRYVNFDVTAITSNEYQIYQEIGNKLNKFEGKPISFSALIKNNGTKSIKLKFHVGFDVDNNGTEDIIKESKSIFVGANGNEAELISATFLCPVENNDNQNNKVLIKMIIFDVTDPFEFDLYFIKPEFSKFITPIYVDQTLEKLKIDNV